MKCELFLLFYVIVVVPIECEECSLLINEFNAGDPKRIEKFDFIELKSICEGFQKSIDLNEYKVLGLASGTEHNSAATVELVINLSAWRTNDDGLLTIGGPGIITTDYSVPNDQVVFRQSFVSGIKSMTNFLKTGSSRNLEAIAIIKTPEYDKRFQFTLTKKRNYILMTSELKQLLKTILVDLIVYGKRAPYDRCNFFEEIYPPYRNKKYVLREFDDVSGGTDYSLNRCTFESDGFLPEKFRIGRLTPGSENDCSGTHFILEDHISEACAVQSNDFKIDPLEYVSVIMSTNATAQCTSSIPTSEYLSSSSQLIEAIVKSEVNTAAQDLCTSKSLYPDGGNVVFDLKEANSRKRRLSSQDIDYSTEYEWESDRHFKDDWLEQMRKYQKGIMPYAKVESNKVWFEYLFNEAKPALSRYRCRLCVKYHDKFRVNNVIKSDLAKVTGTLKNSYKKNSEAISEHSSKKSHQMIIQRLQRDANSKQPKIFKEIQHKEEVLNEGRLKATANMMRTVFVEVKSNLPFSTHHDIVLLQKFHNADLGVRHHSQYSAKQIARSISDLMHDNLLAEIVKTDMPISMILDGLLDANENSYIAVYFQTIEGNRPLFFFYRLIPVEDTSVYALANLLMKTLSSEKHNFNEYLKRNIIAFGCDASSAFFDPGFQDEILTWAHHSVVKFHYMGHRLSLTISNALPTIFKGEEAVIILFRVVINGIIEIYQHEGFNRPPELKRLVRQMSTSQLNYIFNIHWLTSIWNWLPKVMHAWTSLVNDLEIIANDEDVDESIRSKAGLTRRRLTSKDFLIFLNFILDLSSHLNYFDSLMQRKASLAIDLNSMVSKLYKILDELQYSHGKYTTWFLDETLCSGRKCRDEKEFRNVDDATYKNIKLNGPREFFMLNALKEDTIRLVKGVIKKYLPLDGNLHLLDIFSPKKLPKSDFEICGYGHTEIAQLLKYYDRWPARQELLESWTKLLKWIIKRDDFCSLTAPEVQSDVFWSLILYECDEQWILPAKKMIHSVLVSPACSADIRRGFDLMNQIRSTGRTDLKKEDLNAIMRIRLNGVNKLEQFAATKYAKHWVETTSELTDDESQTFLPQSNALNEEETYEHIMPPSTYL